MVWGYVKRFMINIGKFWRKCEYVDLCLEYWFDKIRVGNIFLVLFRLNMVNKRFIIWLEIFKKFYDYRVERYYKFLGCNFDIYLIWVIWLVDFSY